MNPITVKNAFYVKLGRGGKWEESSIKEGKIRIGWTQQTLEDINSGQWDIIQKQLNEEIQDKGTATRDLRALQMIATSTSDDIWITFSQSHLWWCRVSDLNIYKDKISKYKKVDGKWQNSSIHGKPLLIPNIPGTLSKLQGFRGTICKVREKDDLIRVINHQYSSEYVAILHSKHDLQRHVENGIRKLHWKDFETLTDLIFRQSGWRRISVVGESMRYSDIELEDPITGDLYQVQVKSSASLSEFQKYTSMFDREKYRRLYFVIHTPDKKLTTLTNGEDEQIELLFASHLAEKVVSLGIVDWLMKKIQ